MRILKSLAIGIFLTTLAATSANATVLHVDITGAYTGSFDVQSNPVPDFADPTSAFGLYGVTVLPDLPGNNGRVFFNITSYGGAISILNNSTFAVLFESYGLQMFSGPVTSPTILPGVYDVASLFGGPVTGTVTISAGSVPEPLTLSLFAAGLLGATAMRRRRKA